jgi:hypothetical protein
MRAISSATGKIIAAVVSHALAAEDRLQLELAARSGLIGRQHPGAGRPEAREGLRQAELPGRVVRHELAVDQILTDCHAGHVIPRLALGYRRRGAADHDDQLDLVVDERAG